VSPSYPQSCDCETVNLLTWVRSRTKTQHDPTEVRTLLQSPHDCSLWATVPWNRVNHSALEKTYPHPTTLREWIKATCHQYELWAEIKASMGRDFRQPQVSANELHKWHTMLRTKRHPWQRLKRKDCMDLDVVEVNALTINKKTKLQKEGHCFLCKHLVLRFYPLITLLSPMDLLDLSLVRCYFGRMSAIPFVIEISTITLWYFAYWWSSDTFDSLLCRSIWRSCDIIKVWYFL
jgi:hypothetical protein